MSLHLYFHHDGECQVSSRELESDETEAPIHLDLSSAIKESEENALCGLLAIHWLHVASRQLGDTEYGSLLEKLLGIAFRAGQENRGD